MNNAMLCSSKLNKLSKTCNIILNKWFLEKIVQYNSIIYHNFQQCQTLHATVIRSETIKEVERKTNDLERFRDLTRAGPSLKDFLSKTEIPIDPIRVPNIPYIQNINGSDQKVYFEVYGCQMNVNDTEVIWSILKSHGYKKVEDIKEANIILFITCSIRDNAEQKIWNRLTDLNHLRKKKKKNPIKIGLLGCMAERLKDKILERGKLVDVIAGPDSYKDLPRLLSIPDNETAINVVLSFDETYADITPVRLNPNSTSAFVTIMRGCDNMCTYCIVPFTRGRERSRPIESIVKEIQSLSDDGVKEIVLLGQNVNSYRDMSQLKLYTNMETHLAKGFKTVYKNKKGGRRFCDLLDEVSRINPEMRIRFTSPHPKDFPDEVLQLIAERPNICKEIHLPAQSGNSRILEKMRRGYTREAYIDLVHHIRQIIPNIYLSSDFITGFCGETEEEFQDTLSLIELIKYNKAFLFSYSMREKTTAHRRYQDDVPPNVKQNRLERMISKYRTEAEKLNKLQIGQSQLVLVEKPSKRSHDSFQTKNDGNTRVIIPSMSIPIGKHSRDEKPIKIGDYVVVKIENANFQTLIDRKSVV